MIRREHTLVESRERKRKRNVGRGETGQRKGGKIEKVQRAESKKKKKNLETEGKAAGKRVY